MAINPGHNGSVAVVSDGKLVYYIEEERLSRHKYDGNPFLGMIDVFKRYSVDILVIGGTNSEELGKLQWTGEDVFTALARKINPKIKIYPASNGHHIGHVGCTFYNSGFDKAIAVIVDGAGSFFVKNDDNGELISSGYETDSVVVCEYPLNFNILYKKYGNNHTRGFSNGVDEYDDTVPTVKAYEAVTQYLGFGFIEAGKTMGLAPYGKPDPNIPELFINERGNKNVFVNNFPAGAYIDQYKNEYLRQYADPAEWHKDPSKITEVSKNLAYKIQKDSQEIVLAQIKRAIEKTGIKKVCIAGGYGLNCTANYFYRKNLPADVELYCEPIAHDGGTAIGLAQLFWHQETQSTDINPLTTLYLGPSYDPGTYLNNIDPTEFKISQVLPKDIAKIISKKNIVAMFQGGSEAGPRALGNRSILYDPRDPEGKDFVNIVKGREWFRPFAGTVLKEDANDWFDLAGMDETPFMMYAVDIQADKVDQIPCIAHVDNTCRIQTVSKEQNENYYNLINEFKTITSVPMLFNTSFNLAGDPLVETIDHALDTLRKSKMKYLYLPEIQTLLTKVGI